MKKVLFPLFFLTFGIVLVFYPLFASHFQQFLSDTGDPRLNNLILERASEWLHGNFTFSDLLNVPYYYPAKAVGAWTDTLWATAPVYALLRFLGLTMTTAFSSWLLMMCVFNFLSAYFVLTKKFRFEVLGASLGAYLFAFGTCRLSQLGHAQLFPAFATPFFFAWAFDGFQNLPAINHKKIGLALCALVFQIYSGFYLGWFLVLTTFLGLAYLFLRKTTRPLLITAIKNNWKPLSAYSIGSAILLLPQMLPYLEAAKLFGRRPYSSVRATFPRISSYLNVESLNGFEGWTNHFFGADLLPLPQEHRLGIGLFTTGFIAYGLYRGRKNNLLLKSARVLTLLLLAVSISFFNVSLWGFIYLAFPGGSAIRAVGRIVMTLLFLYSIPVAYLVDEMKGKLRWLCCLLILSEQIYLVPNYNLPEVQKRIDTIAARIPSPCKIFYGMGREPGTVDDITQIDWMEVAHQSGRQTLNGYYGHDPIGWYLSPGSPYQLSTWETLRGFKLTRSCVVKAD